MNRDEFYSRLVIATADVIQSAQRVVHDKIPSECLYLIRDRNCVDGFVPDEAKLPPVPIEKMDATSVVDALHYKGRFPDLIFLAVIAVEGEKAIVRLSCSRVYSSLEDQLAHSISQYIHEMIPFRIYLPIPPKGWLIKENGVPNLERSIKENGKYSL